MQGIVDTSTHTQTCVHMYTVMYQKCINNGGPLTFYPIEHSYIHMYVRMCKHV